MSNYSGFDTSGTFKSELSERMWGILREGCIPYTPALVRESKHGFIAAWFYGIHGGCFNTYALELIRGIPELKVIGAATEGNMTFIGLQFN